MKKRSMSAIVTIELISITVVVGAIDSACTEATATEANDTTTHGRSHT